MYIAPHFKVDFKVEVKIIFEVETMNPIFYRVFYSINRPIFIPNKSFSETHLKF